MKIEISETTTQSFLLPKYVFELGPSSSRRLSKLPEAAVCRHAPRIRSRPRGRRATGGVGFADHELGQTHVRHLALSGFLGLSKGSAKTLRKKETVFLRVAWDRCWSSLEVRVPLCIFWGRTDGSGGVGDLHVFPKLGSWLSGWPPQVRSPRFDVPTCAFKCPSSVKSRFSGLRSL